MRKYLPKILRNALYLLCMNMGNLFALFLFSIFLARQLGANALGLYTLFTAVLMPFFYLVDFGQSTSLVQEIAKAPGKTLTVLKRTFFIKIVLTVCAYTLLVAFAIVYFEQTEERYLFALFGLILLPRAFYSTLEAVLRAHQKMAKLMAAAIPTTIILPVGSWLLLQGGYGFGPILGLLIVLEALKGVLVAVIAARELSIRMPTVFGAAEVSACLQMLRRSIPFFAIGIVGILHNRLDVVLLASLRDHAEVGIFSGANNFLNVLKFAPSVIVAAFFPAISGLESHGRALKTLSQRTLVLQLATASILSLVFFSLAPYLIHYTYRFEGSAEILQWLVWALIPMSIYSTLIYVFYQADKAAWSFGILTVAVGVNLVVNSFLIPKLGAKALAFGRIGSESICCVLATYLFLRLLRRNREARHEQLPKPCAETDLHPYKVPV